MKLLNISLLHYTCPPVVGGVEEIIRQQASLFSRNYHHVKVFAGLGGPANQNYEVEINPLLGSRNPEILHLQNHLSESSEELNRFEDKIYSYLVEKTAHFDVLIAHNVLSMHYNLPLTRALHRLANSGEISVIAWNHDSPFFYENYPVYLDERPWQILREYNPHINYITISESRKDQFTRLMGNDISIRVIPNGIDLIRFFKLDPLTVRVIREQRLFEAEFLLVQPSRLHPRKNIEFTIKVVRSLQDRGMHARLLLTGAYDPHEEKTVQYYRKLRALSRELGVDQDILIMAEYHFESGEKLKSDRITIRDLYLIADMLFMPSLQEGFGIPLLEAGMTRLPIVCSDIPPFREIGDHNVCYFSLNESSEQVAEKILQFSERLHTHKMYRDVRRKYVWDNIYHRDLLPYLQEVVTRKKNQEKEKSDSLS